MAPQSYYLGGKIRASDFNGFADDINEIVGLGAGDSGYGQNQLMVSYVASGAKIKAANWDELLTSMKFAAQHQGTPIGVPTNTSHADFPALSKVIKIIPTLLNDITNIRGNKLNSDIAYMSLDSNKISSSKTFVEPGNTGNYWNATVNPQYYTFRTTFADADARRNFFNAGGEIRISCDLSGYDASHAQNTNWNDLFESVSTIKMSHIETVSSNGVGIPYAGFKDLTNSYQVVYQKGGTGDYVANQLKVSAKLDGTTGIDIKVEFDDGHLADTGSWSNDGGGTWTGEDYVDGTLSVTIDQLRADDNDASNLGVVSTTPTYSHISEL